MKVTHTDVQTGPTAKTSATYRILHTADWHLGKLLNDRSREEEHARFLAWLVEKVQAFDVDAVLLAGDLFDTAHPASSAQKLYYDFVRELSALGSCTLVLIAGNHDSAAQLEAPRGILEALNAHVVGFMPENPADALLFLPDSSHPAVAVATVPFLRDRDLRTGRAGETREEIRDRLVEGIRGQYLAVVDAFLTGEETASNPSHVRCPLIGTGHLTVLGAVRAESEREIHIGGLGSVGPDVFPDEFAYVALGHLHRPQAARGDQRIRYAGSPLPLSFNEAGDRKQVTFLDVSVAEISVTALDVPIFRKLVRIRCPISEVAAFLDDIETPDEQLPPWVELTVEGSGAADELNEEIRETASGRALEVLKVQREHPEIEAVMDADDFSDEEALGNTIGRPERVFQHLLDSRPDLFADDRERDELVRAFAELLEQVQSGVDT